MVPHPNKPYWEATDREKALVLLDGEPKLLSKYSDGVFFDEIRLIEFGLRWFKKEAGLSDGMTKERPVNFEKELNQWIKTY